MSPARRRFVALILLVLAVGGVQPSRAAEIEFTGVFDIAYGDNQDFTAGWQVYSLTQPDGTVSAVEAAPGAFERSPESLRGDEVRVRGVEQPDGTIVAGSVGPADQASGGEIGAAVTGATAWAVLLCKYSDIAAITNPASYYTSLMDTSYPRLDHYWRNQSYNLINLTGTGVHGWFTLPNTQAYYTNAANSDSTNLTNLATDCTAAANPSVNFASYYGIIVMVNGTVTGGAGGWGGSRTLALDGPSKSWPFAWMPSTGHRPGVVAHEMGHGYGLPHSSALPYAGLADDYHSNYDVMSSGFWNAGSAYDPYASAGTGTIAYHRDRLGWISATKKFTPATGTSTTITLAALGDAVPGSGIYQMAQIPIPSSTHFYTLEVRKQRTGTEYYDNGIPLEGVVIHTVNPDTGASGRSADALVVDGDTDHTPFLDEGERWTPGETFTDAPAGVTVEVLTANADGSYTVRIGYGAPGATIVQSGGTTEVSETGPTSDTYTVALRTPPASNVTISLAHADGQVAVSPSTLTFTPATWNTAQTVTVTAIDDSVGEASPHTATVTHSASSTDPAYNGVTIAPVLVAVTDNDSGLVLAHTAGSTTVTEGGASDTYTVRLLSQPTANVVLTPQGGGEISTSPATVTFTSTNWGTAQTVTVSAVNDEVDEPATETVTLTHSMASTDARYSGVAPQTLAVSVIDNDTAGIALGKTATSSTEGGASDTYSVTLLSRPVANVVVAANPSNGQVSLSPSTLTFTPTGPLSQTITVQAVNDDVDEATTTTTVTHAVTSSDPNYAAMPLGNVTASVIDNDVAGVTLTQSGGSTVVTEGGASDTYTLVLATQPTASVTITPSGPSSQVALSPSSVTFTATDWNVAKTITVTAVNDTVEESPSQTVSVTHALSSADPFYSPVTVPSVTVTVNDNDDRTAPQTTIRNGTNSVVLFGQRIEGTVTDAVSGVAGVDVTLRNIAGPTSSFNAQVTGCNAARTSCSWYWIVPTSTLPGIYDVNARGRDLAGNQESPGPTVRLVVV